MVAKGPRGSPFEAQRIKKVGAFLYQSLHRWFFTSVLTASIAGYGGDKSTASYPIVCFEVHDLFSTASADDRATADMGPAR